VLILAPRHEDVWDSEFLSSALHGCELSASRTGRFDLGARVPGTHLTGGWVGIRTHLDAMAKRKKISSLLLLGIETRPSSPYPNYYTDRATPARGLRW